MAVESKDKVLEVVGVGDKKDIKPEENEAEVAEVAEVDS